MWSSQFRIYTHPQSPSVLILVLPESAQKLPSMFAEIADMTAMKQMAALADAVIRTALPGVGSVVRVGKHKVNVRNVRKCDVGAADRCA